MRIAGGVKASLVGLALVGIATSGCGRRDGPTRELVSVSGTVTFNGQPLEQGEVHFVSSGSRSVGEGYFVDACVVKQGGFQGKTEPGERVVQIWSFRQSDAAPDPVTGDKPLPINIIPAQFSENSKLTVTVSESGSNTFTFEIGSGK